jgi:hypothetical protein
MPDQLMSEIPRAKRSTWEFTPTSWSRGSFEVAVVVGVGMGMGIGIGLVLGIGMQVFLGQGIDTGRPSRRHAGHAQKPELDLRYLIVYLMPCMVNYRLP